MTSTDVAPGRLIVVSGLPGVGKTTVAETVARRTDAVHLSIDAVEESILRCGLPAGWQAGVEPTWEDVLRRRTDYAPWTDDHVEIDAALRSSDEIATMVINRHPRDLGGRRR